jgi:hypothetical protein
LQNEDEMFKWLQAAVEDRAVWMGYLAADPVFDRYHSDKRFQALVRRVGVAVKTDAHAGHRTKTLPSS